MNGRGSPLGYKLFGIVSLLIDLGGLLLGVSEGQVRSFLIGVTHLSAAYGLWTGVGRGGIAGILAYGPIGGMITFLRALGDPVALTLTVVVAVVVVGYLYTKEWGNPIQAIRSTS